MTLRVFRVLEGARAEDLLARALRDPWSLLPELKPVAPPPATPFGSPPFAGLDSLGRLVLLEVRTEPVRVLPTALLAQRAWLRRHPASMGQAFAGGSGGTPGLQLLAPSFSPPLIAAAEEVADLTLTRVRVLSHGSETALLLEPVAGRAPPAPLARRPVPPERLQEQAELWLERMAPGLQRRGEGGALVVTLQERTVARLEPAGDALRVEMAGEAAHLVHTLAELEAVLMQVLAQSFRLVGGKGSTGLRREDILTTAELDALLREESRGPDP